jgi:hypothetical protein
MKMIHETHEKHKKNLRNLWFPLFHHLREGFIMRGCYLIKYPAEKKLTQCFNENGAVIPKPTFVNGITPPV